MPQIVKRVPISASAEKVWIVLADFGSAERWAPTVVRSSSSGQIKRGVGARRILTTTTGEVTEEVIIEWNEGHSFTFEIPDGLSSMIKALRETWLIRQSSKGTEVVVTMDYQIKDGALNSVMDFLVVGRILKKILVQNLAGLKYHMETGEIVTSKTAKLPIAAVA